MPYHSRALAMDWRNVPKSFQYLIHALMKAISGGYMANGVAIAILQVRFNTIRQNWIPTLILLIGLIVGLTSIYATIILKINTPGNPPTIIGIIGIVLLLSGYYFNRKVFNFQ